jgi:prefoldin subunit 5
MSNNRIDALEAHIENIVTSITNLTEAIDKLAETMLEAQVSIEVEQTISKQDLQDIVEKWYNKDRLRGRLK